MAEVVRLGLRRGLEGQCHRLVPEALDRDVAGGPAVALESRGRGGEDPARRRRAGVVPSGVDVRRVWKDETRIGPARQRDKMALVEEHILAGDTVTEALRATDGFFPPLTCELIEVGEKTGKLDEVMFRLEEHYKMMLSLRNEFLMGILWPSLQLFGAIGVVDG